MCSRKHCSGVLKLGHLICQFCVLTSPLLVLFSCHYRAAERGQYRDPQQQLRFHQWFDPAELRRISLATAHQRQPTAQPVPNQLPLKKNHHPGRSRDVHALLCKQTSSGTQPVSH
ncbi:hypothetical protein NL108_017751 [Boleophthalmus pectinirostris]|nr:hypothetical protein NL108_017751 [Boleophthalmus pectinirostris]